jgi:hypothetical protein
MINELKVTQVFFLRNLYLFVLHILTEAYWRLTV